MLMDYSDLSALMKPIIEDRLDHHYLNETLPLESPTSERIAEWLAEQIAPLLPDGVSLAFIRIEETCTARAMFSRE
jgi:6-pyruvoyltetrahydropterin/6-carboxytetrahydropterin synthase